MTRAPTIDGAPDVTKLGGTQLRILTALREAGAAGLTAGQVATQLGISPTNAPRALRKLEERGLATFSADRPALWRASVDADREVSTAPCAGGGWNGANPVVIRPPGSPRAAAGNRTLDGASPEAGGTAT